MNICLKKLIALVFILSLHLAANANAQTNFENFSIPDGLSNSDVMAIHQDRSGFIWLGTQDGLNCYDGYNFTVFKNDPGDTNSLVDNSIYWIHEDKQNNLWIATRNGLSRFDLNTYTFTNYWIDANNLINNWNFMISILIDNEERMWVGTVRHGVLLFDRKTGNFEKIKLHSDEADIEIMNAVAAIYQTSDNTIYVPAINYGMLVYDRSTGMLRKLRFGSDKKDPFYGNMVRTMHEDSKGNLWIGSNKGLHVYLRNKHQLEFYELFESPKIPGPNAPLVTDLVEDNSGNLWITTSLHGLYKMNMNSREVVKIAEDNENNSMNKVNQYWSGILDQSGILWFGTRFKGVYKYDYEREPFNVYRNTPDENSLSNNEIRSIYESKFFPNTFWIGTREGGLNRLNRSTEEFDVPLTSAINGQQLSGKYISALTEHKNHLWIGTLDDGLYDWNLTTNKLNQISVGEAPDKISNEGIRSLLHDQDGNLWIGTNNGLNHLNLSTGEIFQYPSYSSKTYSSEILTNLNDLVQTKKPSAALLQVMDNETQSKKFTVSEAGYFLLAGVGEGLDIWNMVDYGWLESQSGDTLIGFENYNSSYYLSGDQKNRIQLSATRLEAGEYNLRYLSDDSHSYGAWNAQPPADSAYWGIQILPLSQNEYKLWDSLLTLQDNEVVIADRVIRDIHLAKNNILWLGCDIYGLIKYDLDQEKIKIYRHRRLDPNSISSDRVDDIFEDENGILWLATGNGLCRFDPKTERFKTYTSNDGLPTNFIVSIIKDDLGYFWLGTRSGLVKFDPNTANNVPAFVTYDTRDGIQGYEFWPDAALKSSMGELFFGGSNGLNSFFPGKSNPHPPMVQLTNLYLNNQVILPQEEGSPLEEHITRTKKITLGYDQNDFALDYSALHYARPDKNKLAYKLEGFNDKWILDNRRYASYTNLDPGKYIFKLKGANSDGIWNQSDRELMIEILPPWWRTVWAYISYFLIVAGLIFSFDRIQRHRVTLRERNKAQIREAELKVKAAEADTRAIKAENERKTHELEEARKLQLSMLPKKLPQLPNLDIAVYMKTATEVGGDYYDFHVDMDGTLTVVIGDATGHGLKAGTMVTTTKSLFSSHAANPDILYTFGEITRCIKHMDMHMLSMCLSILKIKNNDLTLSSAGMPPALLYRKSENKTNELELKGMPLGTFQDFPYQLVKNELHPGDTLLLYSDGLPELFNEKREMFGYERVVDVFNRNANEKAEVIIEKLKSEGTEWVNDSPPDDDVTFVVIKARG